MPQRASRTLRNHRPGNCREGAKIWGEPYRPNDPVYRNDPNFETPKEYFKAVLTCIGSVYKNTPISLADMACAAGAFIWHARQHLRLTRTLGMDISGGLIAAARSRMPEVEWRRGSLTDPHPNLHESFDVATCLGTLALFDDIDPIIRNLISWIKPGGHLYLFDQVNDDPVDMIMRYRQTTPGNESAWQPGFNVRSLITYERTLKPLGAHIRRAIPFHLSFPLKKSSDPLRAWTIETREDPHQLVVGTAQMLRFKILEIQKL